MNRIVITGAACNLSTLLARGLATDSVRLALLWHRCLVAEYLTGLSNVKAHQVDLGDPDSLSSVKKL